MAHRTLLLLFVLVSGYDPHHARAGDAAPPGTVASLAQRIGELDYQIGALESERKLMVASDEERAPKLRPRVFGCAGTGLIVASAVPWLYTAMLNGMPHGSDDMHPDTRMRVFSAAAGSLGAGLAIGGIVLAIRGRALRKNTERIEQVSSKIEWLSDEARRLKRLERIYARAEASYSFQGHGAALGLRWRY